MKQTKLIMGLPITIELRDDEVAAAPVMKSLFAYFRQVDKKYSPYKPASEVSQINAGLTPEKWSAEMTAVLELCDQTKQQTNGYFDVWHAGKLDPSGLVKGWAIQNAAQLAWQQGSRNFYIEAGGDIQAHGTNAAGQPWVVGIRNPFKPAEIIKVVELKDQGMATSGTYIRGQHIYDPVHNQPAGRLVKSLTVIGPNVYEADRYATAAFAMGSTGINFIEATRGLEGYQVDEHALATYTSGFERYVSQNA